RRSSAMALSHQAGAVHALRELEDDELRRRGGRDADLDDHPARVGRARVEPAVAADEVRRGRRIPRERARPEERGEALLHTAREPAPEDAIVGLEDGP